MSTPTRRHDIDALRVAAFLLLILYHIGMFYVPWGWHVKSTHILPELEGPMELLNPWRLTLLFVISGAATQFLGAKLDGATLARQRSVRLLVPLVFGMLVIVPPQSWAEVAEKNAYTDGFAAFWLRYISFDQSFGIILPTYNHLWFVAYLWLYTMVVALFWRALPAADRIVTRVLSGPGAVVLPILAFGAWRAFVFPRWGETHTIWADPYAHLHYFTAFLIGLLLARQDAAWALFAKYRHAALIATAVVLGIALYLSGPWEEKPDWRGIAFAFVRAAYVWGVICTLFGYAHHHIRKGSPILSILTEAVFPFYIAHQTAIVLAGHFLSPLKMAAAMEAGIIFVVTAAACVATYALARAVPLLRLPLGLKPVRR